MIAAVLALIEQLLPLMLGSGANAALIEKIISVMISLIPVLVKEFKDLVPIAQNIIEALKADPATTADQLIKLQVLDAQCDQAFDAAAAAALADDGEQ